MPEEGALHNHHCENLKCCTYILLIQYRNLKTKCVMLNYLPGPTLLHISPKNLCGIHKASHVRKIFSSNKGPQHSQKGLRVLIRYFK
jgi:hypothetical protein